MVEPPRGTYESVIHATPEQVWRALIDPDQTQEYYFGTRVESDWNQGSSIVYRNPSGGVDADGEILDASPSRRLETTFRPAWSPDVGGGEPATVRWEIQPVDDGVKVTLVHSGFDFSGPGGDQVHQGWLQILAGLKTLLEGKPPATG